jgi:hypothetical protein
MPGSSTSGLTNESVALMSLPDSPSTWQHTAPDINVTRTTSRALQRQQRARERLAEVPPPYDPQSRTYTLWNSSILGIFCGGSESKVRRARRYTQARGCTHITRLSGHEESGCACSPVPRCASNGQAAPSRPTPARCARAR